MSMPELAAYQRRFIEYALQTEVLRFGRFTLKSGRVSPYFFNAGRFNTGAHLAALGGFYAAAAVGSGIVFDMLFGPAYKGIPLASATAVQLAEQHGRDVPWAFNRKEAKDHGEGGQFVGAEPAGNLLIIDDVITAGTAIRDVMDVIAQTPARPAGVLISVDRQERGQGAASAIDDVEREFGIGVHAIVTMDDIIEYMRASEHYDKYVASMLEYRQEFGVGAGQ